MDKRLVAFLSAPETYGVRGPVLARETSLSWVFMTEDLVFKLKKPVARIFIDYRSVEARRHFCEEEVRLNRRLAPDVYLGTVPVLRVGTGFRLGGEGGAVDWLVKMRRLPAERMLDHELAAGSSPRPDETLGPLFEFFSAAEPVEIGPAAFLSTLREQNRVNADMLLERGLPLPRQPAARVIETAEQLLAAPPPWLLEPVASRRIIEGHGDLRPEHICLTRPPVVIDCLEFSRELRLLDPADELAYLALECRMLGADAFADAILPLYAKRSGIAPSPVLTAFHTMFRALIRARICAMHLFDPRLDQAVWTGKAMRYLSLAEAAMPEMSGAH